jgi:hypothetical protein
VTFALSPFSGPPEGRVLRPSRWRAGCAIVVQHGNRRFLPDFPMRAFFVVVLAPILHIFFAPARFRNQWALRHSARKGPLNASMKALSVGFPGREKSKVTPRW